MVLTSGVIWNHSIASVKDCLHTIGENHKSLVTRELYFSAYVSGKTSFEVIVVPTVFPTYSEVRIYLTPSQTASLSSVVLLSKQVHFHHRVTRSVSELTWLRRW